MDNLYDWSPDSMVEVLLSQPDDFLKIMETLTRIGINPSNTNCVYQTAHILHKRGKYYIVHFKELFCLNGNYATLTHDDIAKRNTIIKLLSDWGLLTIVFNVNKLKDMEYASMKELKVVPFKDKEKYKLISKYSLGNHKIV
jgi:hypothetical protein